MSPVPSSPVSARSRSLPARGVGRPATRLFGGVYSVRRRIATAAAAILAFGLGYHVVFGRNGLIVYQQKRMDTRSLDSEVRMLSQENERLKGHVDRLQSDPDAIENEARSTLHYTRPGEVVVILSETPAGK